MLGVANLTLAATALKFPLGMCIIFSTMGVDATGDHDDRKSNAKILQEF